MGQKFSILSIFAPASDMVVSLTPPTHAPQASAKFFKPQKLLLFKNSKEAYFSVQETKQLSSLGKTFPKKWPSRGCLLNLETQQPQIISRKIWHLLRSKFDSFHLDHPNMCCPNVSQKKS